MLAVSPFPDIAICQLDGATGLKPLPVVPNAKPGAHIRVLSHPDNSFYSITEGILSRYFVRREDGKEATMLTTTAEFAVGSSGGPLFDGCGNVIGMVASTSSVYSGLDEASGEEPTTDSSDSSMGAGDLQMILKMCVPPSDILKLVTGK